MIRLNQLYEEAVEEEALKVARTVAGVLTDSQLMMFAESIAGMSRDNIVSCLLRLVPPEEYRFAAGLQKLVPAGGDLAHHGAGILLAVWMTQRVHGADEAVKYLAEQFDDKTWTFSAHELQARVTGKGAAELEQAARGMGPDQLWDLTGSDYYTQRTASPPTSGTKPNKPAPRAPEPSVPWTGSGKRPKAQPFDPGFNWFGVLKGDE